MNAARLSQILLEPGDVQSGDLTALNAAGLGAWVASRLPDGHTVRPALEPARLTLLARQMVLRRSLLPLLAAWNEAGVDSVLLKGFMLAELAYRVPGTRPFGDIDVLVRPAQLDQILAAASRCGWRADDLVTSPAAWTHEIAHLYSPDGQIRLDVHRSVTPWVSGHRTGGDSQTDAVWAASEPTLIGDVRVRRPSWPDAALLLMLGRCWSGDGGVYKPADFTDLEALSTCPGVSPVALRERALRLGAGRTWQAFLEGCNPWTGRFDYGQPERVRQILRAARQDGARVPRTERIRKVRGAPRLLWNMAQVVPEVVTVSLHLAGSRRGSYSADPRALVKQMTPPWYPAARGPDPLRIVSVIRGVHWLTRLLYPRSPGVCVPRSLATYRALRRRGFPAVYVSGVRRSAEGTIQGHAWVEGPDGPIEAYGEPSNRFLFRTVFEERGVPPATTDPVSTAAAAVSTRESGPARPAD